MALIPTPDHLRASYDYLRAFRPFNRWPMPDSATLAFRVTRERNTAGWYIRVGDAHKIIVSARHAGSHLTVLKIVAHEMIHLKQAIVGTESPANHNADYKRLAAIVCRAWGWDDKDFYL